MKMEKPNLNQTWETWIKIGRRPVSFKQVQDTIRSKIGRTFPRLESDGIINWYQFLIHQYPRDPTNEYFHIRFSLRKNVKRADLDLPEYCVPPERIHLSRDISGVNKALLKNEDIDEAWRILGEQSEWIIDLINIHEDGTGWIPVDQFMQFMHFFMNMMRLGHQGRVTLSF